jgi:two-component system sensor histidine kinase/response regulator
MSGIWPKVKATWKKLIHLGIDESVNFIEKKRIKIIDIITFLCLPVIFIFAVFSSVTGHPLLTWFYGILTVFIAILLYGNYKKKGEKFRIVIIFFITICCAVASVLFGNGQEYYILLITFLSVLFYGFQKEVLYLSLFYAVLYLATEISSFYIVPIEPAPYYIKVSNIIITVSILVYFLYDIKKTYLRSMEDVITEKKNLEEYNTLLVQQAVSLELKNKNIEELKNKNEELSSIVYHQLRSPVATFADILSQYLEYSQFTKEEFLELSKMTQTKVRDTMNIIDNLLMWNQKGADGIQPHALKCELNGIVNKALLQVQSMLKGKELEIECAEKPVLFAYADADHILIILLNILTNAIKFSPLGETIRIGFLSSGDKCKVHISNSGRGIGNDHLKKIFATPHIISTRGTMNESGTGLGLKICKNLIEKNKGSITITSELSRDTTVVLELPTFG